MIKPTPTGMKSAPREYCISFVRWKNHSVRGFVTAMATKMRYGNTMPTMPRMMVRCPSSRWMSTYS